MKDRVKAEIHAAPSKIYNEELARVVEMQKIPRSIVGLYIKQYDYYKSTFLKLRKGLEQAGIAPRSGRS